jgi:hypothetical protein
MAKAVHRVPFNSVRATTSIKSKGTNMIMPLAKDEISSHGPCFVSLRRFIEIASMLAAPSQDAMGKGQVGRTAAPQAFAALAYSPNRRDALSARILVGKQLTPIPSQL